MNELFVKNPHSILAALKKRPKDVLELSPPKDQGEGAWEEILSLAEQHKIRTGFGVSAPPSREQSRDRPGRDQRGRNDRHQKKPQPSGGAFMGRESSHGALIRPKTPTSVEDLFSDVDASKAGVWLALDQLQDPQNLGAIFRSAAFFGIKGIVLTTERSAPMTPTVYDISAGGVEDVPFVPVINLQRAFEKAKDAGLWILGTSEHAKEPIQKIQKDRPWLVVMGNEEKGIRRLTEEACDMICSIPPKGEGVTSLNVSVATGVLLSWLT